MNPSTTNFNELYNKDYELLNDILELYVKNKKLINDFSKTNKNDNELAKVLEEENNNILAEELKKEQIVYENTISLLIEKTEELLLKSRDNDLENKCKKMNNLELLEKIKNEIGGCSKINKNLNKQIIKLGIEYYKRKYLRYKIKYLFD